MSDESANSAERAGSGSASEPDPESGSDPPVLRRIPSPLLAVLAALSLAVVGYGGGNLIGLVVSRGISALGVDFGIIPGTVLSVVLLQGVAFFGLSVAYLRARGLDPVEYVGVRVPDLEGWMYAAAGYVLAFVAAFVMIFLVVFLFELTPAQNRAAELGGEDPRVFLVLIVLAFVLIGPGEELLFRGVIQSRLRETFSAPVAVALATAIFAAVHAPGLIGPITGRLLTITMLFFPGLVFGITYELTDNIVVPSLIHGAYNATLFSLAYLSVAFG
jgi:membrane protease YdiL (CAAX protease family)